MKFGCQQLCSEPAINTNYGAQQELCFNKSFKRNYTISIGISHLKSVMENIIQMDLRNQTKNPTIKLTPVIVRISTSTPTKNLQLLVTPTLEP